MSSSGLNHVVVGRAGSWILAKWAGPILWGGKSNRGVNGPRRIGPLSGRP
ncbi:hypothetical protein A2U01_0086605, partial [Trifolium medium]|nr:hypothetical protein [Trifolium medium]